MSENKALAIVDGMPGTVLAVGPKEMISGASEMATALADVIEKKKLYNIIGGKKHVRVEGWVPLARFNNVIPREISNERREDGSYVARVQLVNLNDGTVLTEASAECGGPEEELWQKRPPYARRSMAATRATSKACRLAYSWIMVLAGYEATPAEEMDGVKDEVNARAEADTKASDKKIPTFAQGEPASISEYRGDYNLWIEIGSVFSLEWAKQHRFRQSKNPVKWFQKYEETVARECRIAIDEYAKGTAENPLL